MDWSNERYVRVYVRDTPDWLLLSWEARSLWMLLLRKLDRAGVLDLGRHGTRGLAAAVGIPLEVVERAMPELLADGCVVQSGTKLVAPNYIEAQETPMTDAQRKRESRGKYRERSLKGVTDSDAGVTNPPDTVTRGHAVSRAVTIGHSVPCCTVPSQAVPKEPPIPPFQDPDPLAAGPAPAEPIKLPRKRVQKPSEPTAEETQATTRILERLAARTGRFYRPTTAEHARRILRLLRARESSQTLEEREQELRLVVWDRANRWADDPKMEEYLRPSTLFGPEKFPDYLAQAKAAWAKQQASREKPLPAGSVIAMVASAMEERDGVG